jgi:hypothetical protein
MILPDYGGPMEQLDHAMKAHIHQVDYMTKKNIRTKVAIFAMNGILSNIGPEYQPHEIAARAVEYADALITELEKP